MLPHSLPGHSFPLTTALASPHGQSALPYDKDLEGQLVTVLGLGVSGRAAVKLALARGAYVVAIDNKKNILPFQDDTSPSWQNDARLMVELGKYDPNHLKNAQRIVVSPGVCIRSNNLEDLIQKGHPVVSELQFASEKIPKGVKIIAVTGTNGKSTVTSFCGQILEHAGKECFTGGNLGVPLSDAALQCIQTRQQENPFEVAVVEVSSYQMEIHGSSFQPSAAAVLNLTPDHMERHQTIENYGTCKCRVFAHMNSSQLAVIPSNDRLLQKLAEDSGGHGTRAWIGDLPGVKVNEAGTHALIHVPTTSEKVELNLNSLNTVGSHNAVNAGTAALLVLGLDVGVDGGTVQDAVPMLKLLPHRMETVAIDADNVQWLNDSKATNVEATYAALKGFSKRPAVVLLGGLAKVLDRQGNIGFSKLTYILQSQRAVVTFGASGEQIKDDLEKGGLQIPCVQCKGLMDAIQVAKGFARKGDAILLSPGCASFDEFRNFEHRGMTFSKIAKGLKQQINIS